MIKGVVLLFLVVASFPVMGQNYQDSKRRLAELVRQPTIELESILVAQINGLKGASDLSEVSFSHIYYLILDSTEYHRSNFQDSSFVQHLRPTFIEKSYRKFSRKKEVIRTCGLASSGNSIYDMDFGEVYVYNKQSALGDQVALRELFRENLVEFAFVVYDSDTRIVFGLTRNEILIFDTRKSPIEKRPITEFVKCCWSELGLKKRK